MSKCADLRNKLIFFLAMLLLVVSQASFASNANTINYCVYDPLGAAGDYFAMAKDYQLAAKRWGVELELISYTSESTAVEDFKEGKCDITNMIGLRARMFNTFTGTIDAPGAVEDYPQMRMVMDLMDSPKLEKYMISGQYEMVGVIPIGACYNFVHDKNLNTQAGFAGKRIAVLSWDSVESSLVEQVGGIPVPADPMTLGSMFNKGLVDVLIGPINLYKPFELYKGIGDSGGIIRRPVLQLSMQLMTRRQKFPDGFGRLSRHYNFTQEDHAFSLIHNMENDVDPRHWIYFTVPQRKAFLEVMRNARALLAKQGIYDKTMLNILKRVRCKSTQSQFECNEVEE